MIRYIEDGQMVEVVLRTQGNLEIFQPTHDMRAMILGVLGRALSLYTVKLHAFAFLPDRASLLLTPRDGEALARFLNHTVSNTARGAQRLTGRSGKIWRKRAAIVPVLDDVAAEARLAELLVLGRDASVADVGGPSAASATSALVDGARLDGYWTDRARAYDAGRRKRWTDPSSLVTHHVIELCPIPAWRDVPEARRRARCRTLVRSAAPPCPKNGAHPEAERAERRIARVTAYATSAETLADYLARRKQVIDAHRAARQQQRAQPDWRFPDRSFPPAPPFVRAHRAARRAPNWRQRAANELSRALDTLAR